MESVNIPGSSKGRTRGLGPLDVGPIPTPGTNFND